MSTIVGEIEQKKIANYPKLSDNMQFFKFLPTQAINITIQITLVCQEFDLISRTTI